jgi:2-oxoglutarate ferredoxin oxidoreductase subunit delta
LLDNRCNRFNNPKETIRDFLKIRVKPMAKAKLKTHHINRDWCKGCGICVEFCPKKVLELDERNKVVALRPADCICCKLCELRCPDLAIEIETESEKTENDEPK